MKLSDLIAEMSLPTIKNPEDAVQKINNAYGFVVQKNQPEGDYWGPITAALKFLRGTTNPEKFERDIKKGLAVMKKLQAYKATRQKAQAKFTTVK